YGLGRTGGLMPRPYDDVDAQSAHRPSWAEGDEHRRAGRRGAIAVRAGHGGSEQAAQARAEAGHPGNAQNGLGDRLGNGL
ncbi:hypothetical protein ACFC8F_40990, partial [Streptomyces hydrogenans]|uniref:hypothetical protein n=1 Tax=Streptomyces hydrogenans TaxID=1873719 RepID=UPI0035E05F31